MNKITHSPFKCYPCSQGGRVYLFSDDKTLD